MIQMEVGVNNRCHGFIGEFPELGDCPLRGCGEPTTIDNDNAVLALDKSVVGVADKLCGVNPIAKLSEQGFLSLCEFHKLGIDPLFGARSGHSSR